MRLSELAYFTDNVDSLVEFYEQLLGTAPMHRGEGIAVFQINDVQLLIHTTYAPAAGDLSCENHVAFEVDDVETAVTHCKAKGIAIEVPPTDYDWGRSAYLRAPDGQLIELAESQTS